MCWHAGADLRSRVRPFIPTCEVASLRARDPDLNVIGKALDTLVRERNTASYDLTQTAPFATSSVARATVQEAADALALLDAIDADPARRHRLLAAALTTPRCQA
jgi:hypothetical protein